MFVVSFVEVATCTVAYGDFVARQSCATKSRAIKSNRKCDFGLAVNFYTS